MINPQKCYNDSGVFGLTFKGTAAELAAVPDGIWTVAEGDLWYDTTNKVWKTYDGSNWSTNGISSVTKTVALANMVDGGAAIASLDFDDAIPLGAVVTRTLITDVTGFIGDTSATVQIGDGTDVDRYSTGTPSVFTTIAALDAGAVSGTVYHAAAKTPKVTVTSGSEWGDVTAGELTATIFFYNA